MRGRVTIVLIFATLTACRGPRPADPMHVDFERSGGVAGMRLRAAVDTATLPPDEARELRKLVAAARLESLPTTMRGTTGADRFQYRLVVREGREERQLSIDESVAPADVQPLLTWLTARARPVTGSPARTPWEPSPAPR